MKRILLIVVACFVIIRTISIFRPSKSIDHNLVLADKLMSNRPDSSLKILEKLNANNFEGENRALYALLMTQARFKNYNFPKSDSMIKIACDYYIPSKDSLRKAQTYFYSGRVDETMGKKESALKKYQKSSLTASKIEDYAFLALIYNRWGLLLRKEHIFKEALNIQNKSLEYSILCKDTLKQICTLKDIGATYAALNKEHRALSYYKKSLHLAELMKNDDYISDLCNNLGLIYRSFTKYEKSLAYMNKSISLLSDSTYIYPKLLAKGDLFTLIHRYDSARYYLNLGRRKNELPSEASYYILMSKLEEQLGNYKEALTFSNKHIDYIFKILNADREKAIAELQSKYDYSLIKNENDKLKISRQQMQIVILAISLIAIIATFLFLYYYYRKRSIKRTMKLELDKMQHDLMNEKSNYFKEKTIEAQRNLIKEKELSMELSQRTEALKQHQERERELKGYIFQMEAIVQKINTFNSMKPLQRSKSESQFTLSFQELNDLEEAVNLCFDHFADRLRAEFPKLKDDDIHLCCLLKMKVPNKNILSLLDTNELTLKKRRYRIKHDKMNLPDDVSSLEEFLLNY